MCSSDLVVYLGRATPSELLNSTDPVLPPWSSISKSLPLWFIAQLGIDADPPNNNEFVPSIFTLPFTFSLAAGLVVPIPTLPVFI